MLPIERSRELRADSVTLILQIDAGLFWFQGHFPHLPILPGVAQLDWVMHYGVSLLAPGKQLGDFMALGKEVFAINAGATGAYFTPARGQEGL